MLNHTFGVISLGRFLTAIRPARYAVRSANRTRFGQGLVSVRTLVVAACVAMSWLAALPQAAIASSVLMSVPGESDVNSAGAFTYSLPIAVPPGTARIVPRLSLDYSSQSGNGLQGLGWSLSGLPAIGRCARTVAQDGVHGSVNYDGSDKFCLEGQRLVALSGVYGANNTEYRTEIESFTKIISYGTAGNGPASFKAWTKSGQILEFGNTADSRIEAVGKTTVRAWAVNKVSDAKGNYVTVEYTDDQTNGEAYPVRIDYTGNPNATPVVMPYNSVQFTYTTRADITIAYQAGSQQKITKLLTNIKTYQAANLVSDYRLAYQAGSSLAHSRLTSITLCDGSGTPVCLAPTTFGWQGGSGSLPTMTGTASTIIPTQSGDFNVDGLTDPFVKAPYFGTQSGTFVASGMTISYTDPISGLPWSGLTAFPNTMVGFVLGDTDGDGYSDVTAMRGIAHGAYARLVVTRNDQLGNLGQIGLIDPLHAGAIFSGDFNGDARTDVFVTGVASYNSTTYLSLGTGSFTAINMSSVYEPITTADFDGDGCTDFLGSTSCTTSFLRTILQVSVNLLSLLLRRNTAPRRFYRVIDKAYRQNLGYNRRGWQRRAFCHERRPPGNRPGRTVVFDPEDERLEVRGCTGEICRHRRDRGRKSSNRHGVAPIAIHCRGCRRNNRRYAWSISLICKSLCTIVSHDTVSVCACNRDSQISCSNGKHS
ncbi:MAG: SpvB/TcaC N-terminal domain-containing protein [bacterium]